MDTRWFTLIHILISLAGIGSGFGVLAGLLAGRVFPRWTAVFLVTAIATSVTGFLFPFQGLTPGIVFAVISLLALLLVGYAYFLRGLAGSWRTVFVAGVGLALYLDVFVLVVQLFQKTPPLKELAPTQSEPAFAITQLFVLLIFVVLTVASARTSIEGQRP